MMARKSGGERGGEGESGKRGERRRGYIYQQLSDPFPFILGTIYM